MNINRVVLTGNLTSDPEVRQLPSGNSLCRLRIASNTRRKQPDGTWGEKPNYFDVTIWGAQGENAARYLARGSGVAIDGRLEWREWTTESGESRQSVEIIADTVQFLGAGGHQSERSADTPQRPGPEAQSHDDSDIPF